MRENKAYVHLVDDDASALLATSRLLRAMGYAVRSYAAAADLLADLRPDTYGCVVADLNMPGMNGLDLQQELTKRELKLPVVFLTGQGSIPATVRAMREGAVDFLEKRAPKEELIRAVQKALEYAAHDRAEQVRIEQIRARFDSLSVREKEVLAHVVLGKLNKQIAADLGIHERTVKLHRTAITTKLQTPSVAQLTQLVMEAGLFQ